MKTPVTNTTDCKHFKRAHRVIIIIIIIIIIIVVVVAKF